MGVFLCLCVGLFVCCFFFCSFVCLFCVLFVFWFFVVVEKTGYQWQFVWWWPLWNVNSATANNTHHEVMTNFIEYFISINIFIRLKYLHHIYNNNIIHITNTKEHCNTLKTGLSSRMCFTCL